MWDSLFSWASSSSLAYIYGKDKSAHEEFLFVYGKEYPRRKRTGKWQLSKPFHRFSYVTLLSGSLLETMSLTRAVPSFRVEQWQVLEGSGIGNDILLPLGRVPQFATRCGG
ncbi:hypothetical protein YC2023_073616 [Brassica napus]